MSRRTQCTEAEALGEAVRRCATSTLPDQVKSVALAMIRDSVGVALAGSVEPSSRAIVGMVIDQQGLPEAGIFGSRTRTPHSSAAMANGVMIHALDYDDTQLPAQVHVSSVVVPAALAVAQRTHASGGALIAAVAIGAEVALRLGAAAPGLFVRRGFHPTPICGSFGAVAAASVLYKLEAPVTAHAFGIVASLASGLQAFMDAPEDSWIKAFHPGWAAHAGCTAAELALRGYRGARTALESSRGLYNALLGPGFPVNDLDLTLNWGEDWQILGVSLKPYPACHFNVPFITAALSIKTEPTFNPAEIVSIECLVPDGAVGIVCEPAEEKAAPKSGYAAKFSLAYSVAVALSKGRARMLDFSDEALDDREVLRIAQLVGYRVDRDSAFPSQYDGQLIVRTTAGVFSQRQTRALGHPTHPMTTADHQAKFRDCASVVLDEASTESLLDWLSAVETKQTVDALFDLCVPSMN
jgi:2-methylcitrate dehydratase PrpD